MDTINGLKIDRMRSTVYVLAEDDEGSNKILELNRAIFAATTLAAQEREHGTYRSVWIQTERGDLLTIGEARETVRHVQKTLDF
jgi:hypothetical protein